MPIEQIITNYLLKPRTSYSLMINGKWGSGKTFAILNKIVPELINQTKNPQLDGKAYYKHIYISLYGITSLEQIDKILIWGILGLDTKNKAVKTIANIGSKLASTALSYLQMSNFSISPEDFGQQKSLKKFVLIFDNIERIDTPEFCGSVLGYINNLTETEGVKALILTDEIKLKQQYKSWENIKEKIVSQEVVFKPDYPKIVNQIIENNFTDDYKIFLIKKIDIIIDAFNKSETKNLRSLIYGLSVFENIFNKISQETDLIDLIEDVLYTSLAISFEFKDGITTKEHYVEHSMVHKKYFDNNLNYIITDSFYEYLVTSDISLLQTDELIKKYRSIRYAPEELKALFRLQNLPYKLLDQNSFFNDLNTLYAATKNGDYQLMFYPIVYKNLNNFSEKNLIDLTSSQIHDMIVSGINKCILKDNFSFNNELKDFLDAEIIDDDIKDIYNLVIKYNDDALEKELTNLVSNHFRILKDHGTGKFFNLLFPNSDNSQRIPVLEYIALDDFLTLLRTSSIEFLQYFMDILNNNEVSFFSLKEQEFLRQLEVSLNFINTLPVPISIELFYLELIKKRIIEKIS